MIRIPIAAVTASALMLATIGLHAQDLSRYRAISATDIRAAAQQFLPKDRRVELTVVPEPAPSPR